MNAIAEWFLGHGLELFGQRISIAELLGQLCALAVVFLAQRRTVATWPVQVAATVLLFVVYGSAHLGGLAGRQVIILLISLYGWWAWTRHRDTVHGVPVRTGTGRQRWALAGFQFGGTALVAALLQAFGASWAPLPDAWIFVGTALAFAAQGLGFVEFWVVWLAVDAVGVPLQLASGLWFSAAIYVVFVALVLHGWRDWARAARQRRERAAAAQETPGSDVCAPAARGSSMR